MIGKGDIENLVGFEVEEYRINKINFPTSPIFNFNFNFIFKDLKLKKIGRYRHPYTISGRFYKKHMKKKIKTKEMYWNKLIVINDPII